MRPLACAIAFSGFALGAACAHPQPKQAELDELNRSIEALRSQNAAYAKQVEELENRLFILNDRLESQKINEEKAEAPRLPTVTLHPSPAPAAPAMTAPVGTEGVAGPDIEYAGEAAKSSANRPVLRLHGEGNEAAISRETPAPTVHVVREGVARPSRDERPEAVALYRRSFEALRAGKHDEAIEGFREFLRTYPSHDLADNSQYWLGECFYDRKDFASAVREFRRVIERYPGGNKVPDALLKVGFSYLALGSIEAGRQTLTQLQRSYPRHEAAARAASRLDDLDRSSPASTSTPTSGESSLSAASASKAAHSREEAP